jgi:hypothetical protein
MAQTLEEFLVNVKYNIDAPSQQRFFESLKRVATSIAGVAGGITGLGVAILELSDKMAKAGEKLYWTSQRVGDSVTQIEGMSFALSNLGMSADQAMQGIERFSAWTRSTGPAATGYLRSLGVTARDTVGQMQQLGAYFRAHGGTLAFAHGTDAQRAQYMITMRQAAQMDINEQTMLGLSSGRLEENERQAGLMQRLVWGKNWQTGPQAFADQSLKVMNQFRQMGFLFTNLSQRFGLGLFNAILPDLTKINVLLIRMLPDMQAFLDRMISYAPAVMHFLEGAIKGFDALIRVALLGMDTFEKFPTAIKLMIGAILALPKAINLIGSPLFWILGGLTALLLLLDDYKAWQDDQKHPGQKTAYFDWGTADKAFGEIMNFHDKANKFIEDLTGIHDGLEKISLLAVGLMAVATSLKAIGTAASFAGGGALSKILGRFGFAARYGLPIAAAVGAAGAIYEANTPENVSLAKKLFGDDSATSLGKALIASTMADMAGTTPEAWIKENFPQWLDPREAIPGEKPKPASEAKPDWSGLPNPDAVAPPVERSSGWDLGSTGFGRWYHDWLDWRSRRGEGARDTRSKNRGIGGEYQLSSLGNDWMVPANFGTGDTSDADRFFNLLRTNFDVVIEKLGGILDTLSDMADALGAGHAARDAGGAGDGGGGGDFGPMLPPHASPEEQEARLRQIEQRESGGRNVNNYRYRENPNYYTASGYWQMVDSTWRHAAGLAGIDTSLYPRAINAPFELQHRAALALINEQGERPWATSAPSLAHRPLGADGGVGSVGGAGAFLSGRHRQHEGVVQNNQVSISVTAPSPGSAATQVAEAQSRVFEHHIRYAKGALLA